MKGMEITTYYVVRMITTIDYYDSYYVYYSVVAVGLRLRSFAATQLLVTRYYVGTVLTGPSMKGTEEITTYNVVLV